MDTEQRPVAVIAPAKPQQRRQRIVLRLLGVFHQRGQASYGRCIEQAAQRQFDTEMAGKPRQQFGSGQRVAAQFEEVVVHADPLHPQQALPQRDQALLQRSARGHVARSLRSARNRQRLAVKLAVGGQRQCRQRHAHGRQHVLGQTRLQLLAQRIKRRQHRIAGRHKIGDQLHRAIAVAVADDRGRGDCRMQQQCGLHFARFDPVSADLQLRVGAAEEFQHPVLAPTRQIAGAVHAPAIGDERIGQEGRIVELLPLPVALGHAGTADVELATGAGRDRLLLAVEYIDARIAQRPTDRYRCRLGRGQAHHRGPHRGFGRAVQVGQPCATLQQPGRQLAAERFAADQGVHLLQWHILVGHQDAPQRGRGLHQADALARDQPRQAVRIVQQTIAGHDRAGAADQRQIQLQRCDIETDRGQRQHPVAGLQLQFLLHGEQEAGQIAVADLHPLGRSGGTGGVEQIGDAIGRGARRGQRRPIGPCLRIEPHDAAQRMLLPLRRFAH